MCHTYVWFKLFEWLLEVSSKSSPKDEQIDQYPGKVKEYFQLLSEFCDPSMFKNYEHILSAHACDILKVRANHSK
jgi:hypothetical protein